MNFKNIFSEAEKEHKYYFQLNNIIEYNII